DHHRRTGHRPARAQADQGRAPQAAARDRAGHRARRGSGPADAGPPGVPRRDLQAHRLRPLRHPFRTARRALPLARHGEGPVVHRRDGPRFARSRGHRRAARRDVHRLRRRHGWGGLRRRRGPRRQRAERGGPPGAPRCRRPDVRRGAGAALRRPPCSPGAPLRGPRRGRRGALRRGGEGTVPAGRRRRGVRPAHLRRRGRAGL
ncbi:MAG: hypothetical protein AVDCRST_MAG07-3418, partial [uncultured Frankineae bacterium]